MSFQYDQYLANHRANVKRGFDWLCENLPDVTNDISDAAWQIEFAHDKSKDEEDEYNAYDAYFYGNNRSYKVVQDYQKAWLTHIHRNPHHWQYWILIHDDMENGELETIFEMPYDYIVEMICDWWSFSWANENLYEIFNWYAEHSKFMKLAPRTRETVEDILDKMKNKLYSLEIEHSGVKGMKWGVRNGPPYPIKDSEKVKKTKNSNNLKNAIGKDIITVQHVDLYGEPNSITQVVRKNGGIDRNYYGNDGRQTKQVSNHNHGQPEKHPYGKNGEHVHDYVYDDSGNLISREPRNLNDEERKENGDIL